MSGSVRLLFTAGSGHGLSTALEVEVSTGVHGEAVRRVEVAGASAELRRSAMNAVVETARILYREHYLDRQVLVRFSAADLGNVRGRSAELAFALGFALACIDHLFPSIAATGLLDSDGVVRAVEGVADKLAAALETLP